jgi:hypothetical protein
LEVVEFSCFVLPICLFLEPMPLLPNKNNAYYVNFTHQHQHCYVPPPKKNLIPFKPGSSVNEADAMSTAQRRQGKKVVHRMLAKKLL